MGREGWLDGAGVFICARDKGTHNAANKNHPGLGIDKVRTLIRRGIRVLGKTWEISAFFKPRLLETVNLSTESETQFDRQGCHHRESA